MVSILVGLVLLSAAGVVYATVLGGDGTYRRYGPRDCLTILEDATPCDGANAWYRPTKDKPTSDGCPRRQRVSEDKDRCLELVHPVKVDIDVTP